MSAWAALLVFAGACGTDPRIPTVLTLSMSSLSFTALGEQQQISSSITDQDGTPLDGAAVSWSSSNGSVASVSESGLVTAQGTGSTDITAEAGSASATAHVTVVQTPAELQRISGDSQTVAAGATLPAPLVLQVNDSRGNPIPGATVIFTVSQGEGNLSTSTAASGSDGRVSTIFTTGTDSGSPQEVSALTQSTSLTVSFTAIVPPNPSAFDIGLRYLSSATPTQRQAFTSARLRWQNVITADLEDFQVQSLADDCATGTPAVSQTVDDVLILVSLITMDGPGGVLGVAGPCFIRAPGDPLTVMGVMQIDTDDLQDLQNDGLLGDVILHEMGHVLGFGTLWDLQGLLADPSLPPPPSCTPIPGTDPHFTGAQAITAFNGAGGLTYTGGAKVPVENIGGCGTVDSHWRELVLTNELMTGYIDLQNPLSRMTIASLADQGYSVDLAAADGFSFLRALRTFGNTPKRLLKNDILRAPIKRVDRHGRVTGVFRR